MTAGAPQVRDCVAAYAARLQAVIGISHQVASPLGAWLLLALAAPASTGPDRAALTEALGCDADTAAAAAAVLLAEPHPLVASAVAVWTAAGAQLGPAFGPWCRQLPPPVGTGDMPGAAARDAWVRQNTFGLIDRFPIADAGDLVLMLASALATKVSWTVPFELAPSASLGAGSPWAGRVRSVLRTPARTAGGHTQYIAVTPDAGDVIVHIATAAGGLLVVSVAAAPGVPAAAPFWRRRTASGFSTRAGTGCRAALAVGPRRGRDAALAAARGHRADRQIHRRAAGLVGTLRAPAD